MGMKGYKVFESDWSCKGYQYKVGETFEEYLPPDCLDCGFHFCTELADCFKFYAFMPYNKVAEVEALGSIYDKEYSIHATDKIRIIREIPWQEVLQLANAGKYNTGGDNVGDYNNGDHNTGNRNSGNCNTGNRNCGNNNCGNRNSGNCNYGGYNTGWYNDGSFNSGSHNIGHKNSGDWNYTNYSSGCFNTDEPKILMFNKLSDWTYRDWQCSVAYDLLRVTHLYENNQEWWDNLIDSNKDVIKSLPNFDKEIFAEIMNIDINTI